MITMSVTIGIQHSRHKVTTVIENVFFLAFGRYVFGTLGNEANIITFSPLSPFH